VKGADVSVGDIKTLIGVNQLFVQSVNRLVCTS